MRGLNRWIGSGNVSRDINYGEMPDGTPVVSFTMASDRVANGSTITAWVKVNVYIEQLVSACKSKLECGGYVLVEGELMNREGRHGKLTEVRAREIIFVKDGGKRDEQRGRNR